MAEEEIIAISDGDSDSQDDDFDDFDGFDVEGAEFSPLPPAQRCGNRPNGNNPATKSASTTEEPPSVQLPSWASLYYSPPVEGFGVASTSNGDLSAFQVAKKQQASGSTDLLVCIPGCPTFGYE